MIPDKYSNLDSKITPEDTATSTLASSQWKCINELEKLYANKIIRGTSNKFMDDCWRENKGTRAINWLSFDLENQCALALLLKISAYYHLESQGIKLQTINGYITQLMKIIEKIIIDNSILAGKRNELLLGLDTIKVDDILVEIDNSIINKNSTHIIQPALNLIFNIPTHFINDFQEFQSNLVFPWKPGKFPDWIKARRAALNAAAPDKKPFRSLPSETAQEIISRSIIMIDQLSEYIIQIQDEAKKYSDSSYSGLLHSQEGLIYVQKIAPNFADILPLEYLVKKKNKISIPWFEALIILLKASCINIIFLTTGLRNVDLTTLQVGCCKPSGSAGFLYYLDAYISKTNNRVHLPVPEPAFKAVCVLEKIRWNKNNNYLVTRDVARKGTTLHDENESSVNKKTINLWLKKFANHFDIPFLNDSNDTEYTAHCYRATVAGWMDSSSNLSILLVRQLFGHSNNLMPLAYLHHNPIFIQERKLIIEQAAEEISLKMAIAAGQKKLSGARGDSLSRGFDQHSVELKAESNSITDKELLTTFHQRIKERILDGSMYAMMTPFSVICTRNPLDSSQTPCANRSDKDKIRDLEVNKEIWNYMQSIPNPEQCIGKQCEFAVLGPWSTAIKDSFSWYIDFLQGRVGRDLSQPELKEEARSFVQQYAPDMQKIFGLEINND